ncbi:hypothetical protein VOLCADRAFT_121571 [Volvox carteri f. nagariensis]|uniref:peptidylprolyl isomerase n=1 Tax=Volvox carteri f. nagariensis TaxID=3068 RepID=D8UDT3_VOLCA|nr:uncharacterized protein VOLCADRAFT_121571 [Volvox carteri f. nagariensis]EFJ42099.1 hypothetical protein VOLCADRAFT_121571 [Volvox carteri f. nagariensis]|eukprot:XP_002956796.1 hypothetical protein VOLCADRAFT_121571 [Volvox carteri f. nagariensis]
MRLLFHSSRAGLTSRSIERPFTNVRPRKTHACVVQRTINSITDQDGENYLGRANGLSGAEAEQNDSPLELGRRGALVALVSALGSVSISSSTLLLPEPALADDFVTLPSGIKVLTIREGEGAQPRPGDTVVVHWAGFTKGYQGKRIDNTSIRDEPYEFKLGAGQAIKAFELAVENMRAGGIVRVEVPGELPELSYPLARGERFTGELISPDLKIYKYRYGPQPAELGGQRALDFVLDNRTLKDFNRTLLFDIKLLAVRRNSSSGSS